MNTNGMDILEITRTIVSEPPKEPNAIQLDFSECNMTSKELFETLLMMFTEAMKILYGDSNGKVNLENITEYEFSQIQEYFLSIGFIVNLNIHSINESEEPDYNFDKKKLKDHHLRLKCNNMIYIISFDIYMPNTTCK
jgi:hypothetical protein